MSKIVSKLALTAGLVLAMAFTLSCSEAQAADNEKRIIGTWAIVNTDGSDGSKWVFNSDGTGTFGKDGNNDRTGRYAVADGKLAVVYSFMYNPNYTVIIDLSISTDGKTAIFSGAFSYLLRKKN
jgi:hypothetical protein